MPLKALFLVYFEDSAAGLVIHGQMKLKIWLCSGDKEEQENPEKRFGFRYPLDYKNLT